MAAEQTIQEPGQALHGVLVVDDEILVRTVLAEYLRDCGYRVIEAANAAEAIEVLTSDLDVDVLFTDIEMPGEMNGFGLAKWTREHRPGLQIMLTSGNPSKAEEARTLCLDEHFVTKPTPFDDLRDRIARILASRTEP
jgi:CheY-like chemotaxis protein